MNYEEFYTEYAELAEKLKEQIATHQKLLKRINRSVETGDLKAAARELPAAGAIVADCDRSMADIAAKIRSADMKAYLESGDFARQLVTLCKERRIDIKGEDNVYEVFPYRLKIDPQNEELMINRRKAAGLRPRAIVEDLEKKRNKLLAAPFKSEQYAAELAAAYDLALLAGSKDKKAIEGADVYLTTIYKFLTPMSRFRREYDMRSYAFDLARLYASDSDEAGDGRRYQFGPSRNNSKAIRIIDAAGNEQFLVTIRFFKA
ncbi:MAG: hypothetical protein LBP73_00635 [Clostridiales Family XIII bacterium]|jgi:hypothetical protein|nr:hypothetical protein [Clostridiales Family XIII bacterium]